MIFSNSIVHRACYKPRKLGKAMLMFYNGVYAGIFGKVKDDGMDLWPVYQHRTEFCSALGQYTIE
jgi:hypothetical protein